MHYTEWLLLSIELAEKRGLDKLGKHLCVGIALSTFNTIWYKLWLQWLGFIFVVILLLDCLLLLIQDTFAAFSLQFFLLMQVNVVLVSFYLQI